MSNELDPLHFEEIARELIPQIADLVRSEECVLSVEITISDKDRLIVSIQMDGQGHVRNLADRNELLRGRFSSS